MVWLDARIPLRFGPASSLAAGEMLLVEADLAGPSGAPHVAQCSCCTPRSRAAAALATLFRRRVTAPGPLATSALAVVSAETEAALREAVSGDPVVSVRFRLA